jgi:hypothetical protein
MSFKAYEAELRRRGSVTMRIENAALECGQTIGPPAARIYGRGIQSSLMLRVGA